MARQTENLQLYARFSKAIHRLCIYREDDRIPASYHCYATLWRYKNKNVLLLKLLTEAAFSFLVVVLRAPPLASRCRRGGQLQCATTRRAFCCMSSNPTRAWSGHGIIIIALWNRFGKRQLRKNRPELKGKEERRGVHNIHATKNGGRIAHPFERGRDGQALGVSDHGAAQVPPDGLQVRQHRHIRYEDSNL